MEWIAMLAASGVPCGVVNSVLEALCGVEASPFTGISRSAPGSCAFHRPSSTSRAMRSDAADGGCSIVRFSDPWGYPGTIPRGSDALH